MSAFLRFTPLVSALPSTVPFVGPEAIERQRGLKVEARIGANENGFGPAPSVLAAMREQAGDIWKYNDPENFDLARRWPPISAWRLPISRSAAASTSFLGRSCAW